MKEKSRKRAKSIVFYLCLMVALVPALRVQAADTTASGTTTSVIPVWISAYYSGGSVMVGEKIDTEKLVVTAWYSDGTTENVTNYALGTELVTKDGVNTFAVAYRGKTTTFTVMGKKASSLYVSYSGGTISVGNKVGRENLNVLVYYSDGTSETVEDYVLSNDVVNTVGSRKVTVVYGGLSTSFTVYGTAAKTVQTLLATYNGEKVVEGNGADPEDVYVTAMYTDGTTERIYNFVMQPSKLESAGTHIVTVIYQGKAATFEAECIVRTLESITVEYIGSSVEIGRYIDKDDVKVTAHYNDKSTEEVTGFTLMPARVLTLGNNTVTVDYFDLKANFKVLGVSKVTADYSNASTFTVTNGSEKATVEVGLPKRLSEDALTGKSLKPDRVQKLLAKIKAQDADYIAFDIVLEDAEEDDIFPLTMRVKLPVGYDLEDTNIYYSPNRKTVIARMNAERLESSRQLELTIHNPGTYIILYQEPEVIEKEEKESDYLD